MANGDGQARRYQADTAHEGLGPQNTEPEPVSFREQIPGVQTGSDAPAHQPATPPRTSPYFNSRKQESFRNAMGRMVQARPDLGPALEQIVVDYPAISRTTAVTLALYNLDEGVVPDHILDEIYQRDIAAQEVAADNPLFRTLKAGSRWAFVTAEDLWNYAPTMSAPRFAINLYQGRTMSGAYDMAVNGANANKIRLERLGFNTDTGTGWLPSEELVPASGQLNWAKVKELIQDGQFEGSPEEQAIQAQQQAMMEAAQDTGFNHYALARAEWLSTLISTEKFGEEDTVSYSPGAAIAIQAFKPGTLAYTLYSGTVDGALRVSVEPIDAIFDQVGDVFRLLNRGVISDTFGLGATSKGSAAAREVLEKMGVTVVDTPIWHVSKYDKAGNPVFRGATGITDRTNIVGGVSQVEIDADKLHHYWERFDEVYVDPNTGGWANPDSVYIKPYIDAGMTPQDLKDLLKKRGGANARVHYTLEHELVHQQNQIRWFEQLESGWAGVDAPEGARYIDQAVVTDEAPKEIRDIAQRMRDENLTIEELLGYGDELQAANQAVVDANSRYAALRSQRSRSGLSKAEIKSLDTQLKQGSAAIRDAKKTAAEYKTTLDNLVEQRAIYDDEISKLLEYDATKVALQRLKDNTWAMPKLVKKYRKQAGMTNRWRPFVNPITATEWLNTRAGQRTVKALARSKDVDYIRKNATYLNDGDILRLVNADTPEDVTDIIRTAFNTQGVGDIQRPTIGWFRAKGSYPLDQLVTMKKFPGGLVSRSLRNMGAWSRKARASVGSNMMSVTDSPERLDTIRSFGATIGATNDQINDIQKLSLKRGHTASGLDEIYQRLKAIDVENLQKRGYTKAEAEVMWDDWKGYATQNEKYWVSNIGNERKWIWFNNKYVEVPANQLEQLPAEAFMEAQFATTHRVLPNIRQTRRLHSQQRRIWETIKKGVLDHTSRTWRPKGYTSTAAMRAGDWSFGIWRDFALMRGGWTVRIIGEEQIRFGASGYSGLFSNPIDYFISMFNKMDFTIPGDDLTLAEIMKTQEALGSAGLRDLSVPPHIVKDTNWTVASFANPNQARLAWAGLTREYILNSSDEIVTAVARNGVDDAYEYLTSVEGREVVKRVAGDAAQESSVAKIANDPELRKYLQVIDLRLAQISGGDGLWFNPATRQWLTAEDVAKIPASEYSSIEKVREAIREEARLKGLDPDEVLHGTSGASRNEIEALLNETRGYNLDELTANGDAAYVTDAGNSDLRNLVATRQLDDITITDDMPFDQVRDIDAKLQAAFENRGVEPPKSWAVSNAELEPPSKNMYNTAVDNFFYWMNAVPSQQLNRQPFFQQSFGKKVAETYWFGDVQMREAIDALRAESRSFGIAFDVGMRQVRRNLGLQKMPKPFKRAADDGPTVSQLSADPTNPAELYHESLLSGAYDRIPLADDPDGFVSGVFYDYLDNLDVAEDKIGNATGMYATRGGREHKDYQHFPGMVFTGNRRVPLERHVEQWFDGSQRMESMYDLAGPSPLQYEQVVQLVEDFDGPIGFSDLLAVGMDEDAALKFMDEWGGFPDDIYNIRRMDELSGEHATDPYSWNPEQAGPIAESVGWRGPMWSGGMARWHGRATGYGEYVDVHIVDHLPHEARTWLDEVGDIEQLYTLEGRYPNLKAMHADVPGTYNRLREETGFEETWETLLDRMLDNPEKGISGIPEAQPYIDELAKLRTKVEGLGLRRLSGSEPHLPGDEYLLTTYRVDGRRLDYNTESIHAVLEWIDTMNSSPHYQQMMFEGRAATRPWNEGRRGYQSSKLPRDYDLSATDDQLREAKWILDLFKGDKVGRGTQMGLDDAANVMGTHLGRDFTKAEYDEFAEMWGHRSYNMQENLVVPDQIQPAARLPKQLIDELAQYGVMAKSNTAVGDLALMLDTNFEPAVVKESLLPTRPFTGNVIDDDWLMTIGDHDPLLNQLDWRESLGIEDAHIEAANHWDFNVEKWEAEGKLTNQIYTTYTPEGPEVRLAFGTWMESEEFRSWAYAVSDYTEQVRQFKAMYDQTLSLHTPVASDVVRSIDDVETAMPWKVEAEFLKSQLPAEFFEPGGMGYQWAVHRTRIDYMYNQLKEGHEWNGSIDEGYDWYYRNFDEQLAENLDNLKTNPDFYTHARQEQWIPEMVNDYEQASIELLAVGNPRKTDGGYDFSAWAPKPGVAETGVLDMSFKGLGQADRDAATKRVFAGADQQRYENLETGPIDKTPRPTNADVDTQAQLEEVLRRAKYDAIDETKQVFYDLTNKANIADAYKFIFPFGDAWYEVLSRWAKIMDPVQSGAQPFRNIRRLQVGVNAARGSGFMSTNDYGENIFNWSLAPGMMSNYFIPNDANVRLQGQMPVSSLMFIDPSVRGITMPGTSPIVQLSTQWLAPTTESIPVFHDTLQWITYGDQTQYRPGDIEELSDVTKGFVPTIFNRIIATAFDEQHRESLGNTKFRIFEALGLSGNATYDLTTPHGARTAWDVASTTGSWLGLLRIMDAFTQPGQPQYSVEFTERDVEESTDDLSYQKVLYEASKLPYEYQVPVMSLLRMHSEYRLSRELWSDTEADLFMIERYGVLPAVLQSGSSGLVDRPTTFGEVEWVNNNEWLYDHAPLTMVGTVPADADDTFSSAAWNNQYGEYLMVEGVENQPIREKRSPSELAQAVERSMGYDQVRWQDSLHEKAVEQLRASYGDGYASDNGYRMKKKELDRILRHNKEQLYTQYQIVNGMHGGKIVGSRTDFTVDQMMQEVIDIGTVGSLANGAFRTNTPHLADVAEQYAEWFNFMYHVSRLQEDGTASGSWWMTGESKQAEALRAMLAYDAERYFEYLTDPDAKAYAKWLNENMLDPALSDWEWIERTFAPELESFPSLVHADTVSIERTP